MCRVMTRGMPHRTMLYVVIQCTLHTRCHLDWCSVVCSSDLVPTTFFVAGSITGILYACHASILEMAADTVSEGTNGIKSVLIRFLICMLPLHCGFQVLKNRLEPVFIFPGRAPFNDYGVRSEEHTSELQSRGHLVCRLLLETHVAHPALPSIPTRRSSDLHASILEMAADTVSEGTNGIKSVLIRFLICMLPLHCGFQVLKNRLEPVFIFPGRAPFNDYGVILKLF